MTSTPPRSPLAVLQAHERATAARVLPVLERATADTLTVLDALAAFIALASLHRQESENNHT